MKFTKIKHIEDQGVIEVLSDKMILSTIVADPAVISARDLDLNLLWQLKVDQYARYIAVSQSEAMIRDDNQTASIDLLTGKIKSIEKGKYYLFKTESYKVSFDIDTADIEVEFHDKTTKIKTGSINGLHFFSGFLVQFGHLQKNLTCYELETGSVVWQLNLNILLSSEKADLLSQIVEHNGCLFFFVSDFNNKVVLSVELATGKLKNRTDKVGGWLVLANNKLYTASPDKIQIIDPFTFNIEEIDFSAALSAPGFRIQWNKFLVVGDKIYFVHENQKGGGEAIVGVLDSISRELLGYTNIAIEEGSFWVSNIKVHRHRLYVETQAGTLHVFEQEKIQ